MTTTEPKLNLITVVLKGPGPEDRMVHNIKLKTKFCKLTANFNAKRGVVPKTFRFLGPDGDRLKEDSTASLAEITVVHNQDGATMTNGELDDNSVVTVVFNGPGPENRLEIKAKAKTPFCKLATAVMKKRDVGPKTYRFFDPLGQKLKATAEQTLKELDIRDMDEVAVHLSQEGGAVDE
ncbi:hypothetical protein H9P43_008766 [Blastocladiella emersonii ATCC 22665]|nr:hypothetical protein H9P43_008766 [Blastocladiella emersonii ATCC 22665]